MFDIRHRRHPVQTFQFWFVVLTSFVGVAVWKLDLLSFPRPLPEMVEEEPMPPPPGGEATAALDAFADPEAAPAPAENVEQVSESGPAMSPIARQLADQTDSSEADYSILAAQRDAAPVAEEVSRPDPQPGLVTAPPVVTASAELTPQTRANPVRSRQKPPELDLAEVDQLVHQGEEVAAQRLMSGWYWKNPESRPQIMDRLNVLARRIYFQGDIHYMDPYAVQFGDRLEKVAAAWRVTPEYLLRLNRLSSPSLKVGQVLKVIQGPFGAVVNLGQQEMTVHAQGYFVARFGVAVQNDINLPLGKFRVVEKLRAGSSPVKTVSGSSPGNLVSSTCIRLRDESGADFWIHGGGGLNSVATSTNPGELQLGDRELEALFDLLLIDSEVLIQP